MGDKVTRYLGYAILAIAVIFSIETFVGGKGNASDGRPVVRQTREYKDSRKKEFLEDVADTAARMEARRARWKQISGGETPEDCERRFNEGRPQ